MSQSVFQFNLKIYTKREKSDMKRPRKEMNSLSVSIETLELKPRYKIEAVS